MIKDEVYYGEISKELFEFLKVCPDCKMVEEDEFIPDYMKDFIGIVEECFKEQITDLLLFVKDEKDIKSYLEVLPKEYKEKIIFAYNKYFNTSNEFKVVFSYKDNILLMDFNDPVFKYKKILGI